jgi:hypothetical protein
VLLTARATVRDQSIADDRADLRIRLRDLAAARVRYGYRRLHVLLKREGHVVNHKLVYRLYVEEGLGIRRRSPRRRKSVQIRPERLQARQSNESLVDGRHVGPAVQRDAVPAADVKCILAWRDNRVSRCRQAGWHYCESGLVTARAAFHSSSICAGFRATAAPSSIF